ncbi:redoxin domain-containing protein [Gulosibacter faecalis]|uniref:Redoxin domain-containing protein n=1 Tax=Gulosibacter faecalis TaxID=272240 RepID=A0ABW5UY17_9MICO|nr:redoxin domain-containing protein [Gulosibacter faecalis]
MTGDSSITAPTNRGDRVTVLGPGSPRVLMFVPGAFTPVCTDEVREFAELAVRAEQLGVQLLVVSCDSPATLAAWLAASDASGRLIGVSDHWPHGAISSLLGSFDDELGTSLRRTWAIRADGTRVLVAGSAAGESRELHDHLRGIEWAADTSTPL